MALISDEDLRKRVVRRGHSMRGVRFPYEQHYMEVARYTQPRLGRNLAGNTSVTAKTGTELNGKLQNSQGIWASGVMANGMATGMTSASMPWFRVTTGDPDLRKWQTVKEWLDIVQDRMLGFLATTNFYSAAKSSYLELGVFGTSATVMVEHHELRAVNWNITVGDYWIGLNDGGVPDTLYRRCDHTAIQLVERFGIDKISKRARTAYDRGDYFQPFGVFHMIEPNYEREYGKSDNKNMKYRSIYWEMPMETANATQAATSGGFGYDGASGATTGQGESSILEFSGFEERPFWAPRWDVVGSETYGRGPGMEALPDLRALQIKELRGQQGEDFMIRPALHGPTQLNNIHANLVPGGLTTMAGADKDTLGPIWEVNPTAVRENSLRIERAEKKVDRTFYADLFMAITNMPGIQPKNIEEITRRNEEALAQLGPAVDRNHNEQLRVALDRTFGICLRRGLIPPPPEELSGQDLLIEFTSVLAQMQRMAGLGSIERFFGFVGTIAGEDPSVIQGVDRDEAIREYGDRVGVPSKIILSPQQLAAVRAQSAKQQQMGQMAGLAPAAKDGAMAAKLLAEAGQSPKT